MENEYPLEIKLSKIKLVLFTLGALAFVIGGIYLFINAETIALENQYKTTLSRLLWLSYK